MIHPASDFLPVASSPSWSVLPPILDDADAVVVAAAEGAEAAVAAAAEAMDDAEEEHVDAYEDTLHRHHHRHHHHHSIPSTLIYKAVVQDGDDDDDGVDADAGVVGVGVVPVTAGDGVAGAAGIGRLQVPFCSHRGRILGPCVVDTPIEYS